MLDQLVPQAPAIQRAFDGDLSSVRSHQAPAASALGALAFTQGSQLPIAFGDESGLSAPAHEAAHVVQQRAGLFKDQY